jgi:hypothetical protein
VCSPKRIQHHSKSIPRCSSLCSRSAGNWSAQRSRRNLRSMSHMYCLAGNNPHPHCQYPRLLYMHPSRRNSCSVGRSQCMTWFQRDKIPNPAQTGYTQEIVGRYALARNVVPKAPAAAQKYWRSSPLHQYVVHHPMFQTPPTTRQNPSNAGRTSRPRRCSSSAFLWAAAIVAALVLVVHA